MIYLNAHKNILLGYTGVCCNAISIALGYNTRKQESYLIEILPEFGMLKPDVYFNNSGIWWERNDCIRMNALLLCAEMCKD